MATILFVIGVFFILGLLFRNKGDSALDTLGQGAKGCLWIVIIIIIIVIYMLSHHHGWR